MNAELAAGAASAAPVPTIEDLSLEDALDAIEGVDRYIADVQPRLVEAMKAKTDLETLIKLRMEEQGAKRFERGEWKGIFRMQKSGSASVFQAAELRAQLEKTGLVPADELDDALPVIVPPPIVKPDLRKTRKLAELGSKIAALLKAHIVEPVEREVFTLERVPRNVTPKAKELNG